MLLRPWIDAVQYLSLFRTSSKLNGQEFQEIHRNMGSLETFKQVRISFYKVVMATKRVRIVPQLASVLRCPVTGGEICIYYNDNLQNVLRIRLMYNVLIKSISTNL